MLRCIMALATLMQLHRHYHTQCDLSSYNNMYNKSVNLLKENQPCLLTQHSLYTHTNSLNNTTQHTVCNIYAYAIHCNKFIYMQCKNVLF